MKIEGCCHCGNISYDLLWPETASVIPARACACTFCRKHGALWSSHPEARLTAWVRRGSLLNRYRFGSNTADFYVCARCGIPLFAISSIDDFRYAVVNVNSMEGLHPAMVENSPSNFDGEELGSRLKRRARNWIRHVDIRIDAD